MRPFWYVAALLVLAGCSGSDLLSREAALAKLKATADLGSLATVIPVRNDILNEGAAQGLWRLVDGEAVLGRAGGEIAEVRRDALVLTEATPVEVSITGVSAVPQASNLNEVQFSWTYPALPDFVKRFAVDGGLGRAVFRLYDDGWRVERLDMTPSRLAMPLTDGEREEVDTDLRQVAAIEAENARLWQAMLSESQAPTAVISEIAFNWRFPNGAATQTIRITDVNVTYRTSYGGESTVYFACIDGVSSFDGSYFHVSAPLNGPAHCTRVNDLVPIRSDRESAEVRELLVAAVQDWRQRFPDVPMVSLRN